MHLSIQNIHSLSSGDFLTQLNSCLSQILSDSEDRDPKNCIIKITVFTKCTDNSDYSNKMNLLNDRLSQSKAFNTPAALVGQPPLDCDTMVEVWILNDIPSKTTFTFKRENQLSALHIDSPQFSCLFSSLYSAKHPSFKENAVETFRLLQASLSEHGFDFNEIVRQWNYIQNIIHLETSSENHYQNYQIFNDLRSFYYGASEFKNGYPSATGIGMDYGGCTIETFAIKEKQSKTIRPVSNSFQVDAHSYSSTVLVGKAIEEVKHASTPKFERGKFILLDEDGFLFISGTASIIGEQTVYAEDVSKQTLTTLKNIDHLASIKNLDNNKISVASHPRLLNYRVYLKNESDYPIVKSICDNHYGEGMGFIVKADICRDNLLVEIEANYLV